jgi:undecaprenol kinase/diacylglycerol kinase (ATP)
MNNIKRQIQSFGFALQGIKSGFHKQLNIKLQLMSGVVAIVLSILLEIKAYEWCLIILCIGFVLALEMLNTALEKLADIVNPNYSDKIKTVKDIAAGAVLIASVTALVIGVIIFGSKIITLLN